MVEGEYGVPVIAHCCLEPHGQVTAWGADKLARALALVQSKTTAFGSFDPLIASLLSLRPALILP